MCGCGQRCGCGRLQPNGEPLPFSYDTAPPGYDGEFHWLRLAPKHPVEIAAVYAAAQIAVSIVCAEKGCNLAVGHKCAHQPDLGSKYES